MSQSPDASVIILYNEDGKMLLEHRAETRKRYPGYWALFGGRPENGETIEETVRREAKEELNYILVNPIFICSQQLATGYKHVFVEKYDGIQEIKLLAHESQGYGWFTLEEAKNHKQIPHDIEPLERVWNYIKKSL